MSSNCESNGKKVSPFGESVKEPGVGKAVSAAFRRALGGLGDCLERLCVEAEALAGRVAAVEYVAEALQAENADFKKRLGEAEQEVAALSSRLDNLDLRLGVKAPASVAEATLSQVPAIPEVPST